MTFMGVGTIMNLTAGNLSEDRTDRPQTGGGKVLTMEEAVLGYQLYPKNLYIQWQGDRNVLTYPEGTNLMGEVAGKEKPEVLMTLAELNRLLEADLKGWPQYEWKDGRTLVIMRQGKRYEIDTDKKVLAYVFPIAKGAQNVTSNGQELLAYTKANNLYYVDANGNEFAVTSDEDPNIVNGQTVSRNEFGINGGIFWSPDGKQLAFYRKDESQVGTFPLLDINSRMGTLREIKYPMAGMKSEQISLGVYQVASGKTVFLDVDDFGREQYLTNIAWSPASDYIYVQVLDRAQKHMKLNQYSAKTGEFVKTLLEEQNERNAKSRHTERNRSIPDLLSSRKTCPEETIYQLGTLDEHASAEDLLNIVTEFIEEFKAKFGEHVHVLDWALHLDESTPHIHERHVFDCENRYGEVAPQQEKALEALGFDLPDPDKPLSRRNNRKISFDTACRKMLFEIAKRHGLELEEEAEYGNRKYLEKQDFILVKQKERLAAQQSKLDELTLKVSDMETLLEDVSAAAYDKAVEVVTDVVCTETRKEDMRMIEDTKKWVLSPERKAPQATREYAAHRLDTVPDKFLKTMQTTATRLQEKLLRPDVRQKGKEQVKEKARDSVLQLLNRLQAEQAQNKPAAQPRIQEGHSEI